MKAVQFNRFGGPEVMEVVDVPTPVAQAGEVLVKVEAAGINFFEVLMRADRYAATPSLPAFPGVEVAGTVEAVGEGVDPGLFGRRVAAPLFVSVRPFGGYADYVAIDASLIVPLPDMLSFEDATALMVQGLTALHLTRQSPPAGRTVLVPAAAGGVGSLLIQLAKGQGARRAVALAGGAAKRDFALSLGTDVAIDSSAADWPARVREASDGAGVEIVYDTVGGALTRQFLDVLASGGELVFAALGRFQRKPAPPAATGHQLGVQARVIAHLVEHGNIDARTVLLMGTTDARRMFTRLRRQGYLYAADNPRGHVDVPNRRGQACFRVHYWTGKRPNDRHAKVRGGR